MTKDGQKALLQRMGELTGKPKESGLHIHPMLNPMREGGGEDYQLTSISSRQRKIAFGSWKPQDLGAPRQNISQWHSDISMETVPSDYTSLRLEELPMCGGDTTFASMYELYDRISKPMQKFLEGLTATYTAPCMFCRRESWLPPFDSFQFIAYTQCASSLHNAYGQGP